MKNLFQVFVLMLIIVSCTNEPQIDYALISGEISNMTGDKVSLYKGSEKVKDISLDENGVFNDTLKNISAGYYSMGHGRERSTLFLQPGDQLTVKLDTKEFDESISYEGLGSARNNYLAKKYLLDEKQTGSFLEFFKLEEAAFSEKLNAINEAKVNLMNETADLDKTFTALEAKNLHFEYLSTLNNYKNYHSYYAKKPDFEPSEEFLKPIKEVDVFNKEDYATVESYKSFVQNYLVQSIYESEDTKGELDQIIEKGSDLLKNDMAGMIAYQIAPSNDKNEILLNGILAMSNDAKFKEQTTAKFNKVKTLAKGMPSPKFTDYENHKGGTTSLDDLKGQYVYIDVWATWCAPCKREIPYLKEIEKDYHGKNISFVSTSIDRAADHNKWVDMVVNKELGGIQLFADNDWSSKFVKDYAIEGIPRFILVDPDGNIVSSDAPRPSDPKLKELFNELKI
ncbi:MAG: TlpA family protein disulfide reductase [bacterium]